MIGFKQAFIGNSIRARRAPPVAVMSTFVIDSNDNVQTEKDTMKLQKIRKPSLGSGDFDLTFVLMILSLHESFIIITPYAQQVHMKIRLVTDKYREEKTTDTESPPMGVHTEYETGCDDSTLASIGSTVAMHQPIITRVILCARLKPLLSNG